MCVCTVCVFTCVCRHVHVCVTEVRLRTKCSSVGELKLWVVMKPTLIVVHAHCLLNVGYVGIGTIG